jgi:hypothetical protein
MISLAFFIAVGFSRLFYEKNDLALAKHYAHFGLKPHYSSFIIPLAEADGNGFSLTLNS